MNLLRCKDLSVTVFSRQQMIIADREYQKLARSVKQELVGKYVYSMKETDALGLPVTYFIEDYFPALSQIIFRRLFDQNMILLLH